jgi:G3E family GTPase
MLAERSLCAQAPTMPTLTTQLRCRYGKEVPEGDDRNLSALLLDQVEFADVILVNKVDLLADQPGAVDRLVHGLQQLNPRARIVPCKHCKVPLQAVINTGMFDFDQVGG